MTFRVDNLEQVLDRVVAALQIAKPTWMLMYDDDLLPAHVAALLQRGAASARKDAADSPTEEGVFGSGGIRVSYNSVGEFTEVHVLVGTVYDDTPEDGAP